MFHRSVQRRILEGTTLRNHCRDKIKSYQTTRRYIPSYSPCWYTYSIWYTDTQLPNCTPLDTSYLLCWETQISANYQRTFRVGFNGFDLGLHSWGPAAFSSCCWYGLQFQLKARVFANCWFVGFHLVPLAAPKQAVYVLRRSCISCLVNMKPFSGSHLRVDYSYWGVSSRLGRGLVRSCRLFKSPSFHTLHLPSNRHSWFMRSQYAKLI